VGTNIYGDVLAVTGDDGTGHLIPFDAIASWEIGRAHV